MTELEKTSLQQWISTRAAAVRKAYTAFAAMQENGFGDMLIDETTPVQIKCPIPNHGPDNKPSARYYPATGDRFDYVRCFKCKKNLSAIDLHMMFKGFDFMRALAELERRFNIRIPRRPDSPAIELPKDKGASYQSDKWQDVPLMLDVLESKLGRIRDKAVLGDFVRFCRVLDAVRWDLDRSGGKPTSEMVTVLWKLRDRMDSVMDASTDANL